MKAIRHAPHGAPAAAALAACLLVGLLVVTASPRAEAGMPWKDWLFGCKGRACPEAPAGVEGDGDWYWLRSPDQEKRVVISLYNRYCIRCHGVDGRGVWDIPDVPDFTNACWQGSRSDPQLVRIILEGRGAVMPPFRGTLTLEEAWAMARYLRTFGPGGEGQPPARPAPEHAAEKTPPATAPAAPEAGLPQGGGIRLPAP